MIIKDIYDIIEVMETKGKLFIGIQGYFISNAEMSGRD